MIMTQQAYANYNLTHTHIHTYIDITRGLKKNTFRHNAHNYTYSMKRN